MRLWHYKLIPFLPRQQLLGQHRECCALRGKSWGRKHATVDYAFQQGPDVLFAYHTLVLHEMKRRGYHYNAVWQCSVYRGAKCAPWPNFGPVPPDTTMMLYSEHDDNYLMECLNNLRSKGVDIHYPAD